MTTPQEREQEIREREQVAAPGPWLTSHPKHVNIYHDIYDFGGLHIVASLVRSPEAVFIASARDDIPYLLARVAQLEAALEELMADTDEQPALRIWAKHILGNMPPD